MVVLGLVVLGTPVSGEIGLHLHLVGKAINQLVGAVLLGQRHLLLQIDELLLQLLS